MDAITVPSIPPTENRAQFQGTREAPARAKCCPECCRLQCLLAPSAIGHARSEAVRPLGTLKYRGANTGDSIFRPTDDPEAIVIIRSGLVKLVDYTEGGAERIVLLAGRGSAIGLEAVIGRPMRYGAVAIRPALICRIPVAVLATLGRTDAGIYRQLMSLWQANLEFADRSLARYNSGPIALRILRLIADQVSGEPSNGNFEINLLRRQDMAAVMGVAPENVSRAIANFRRKKLLRKMSRDVYRCDLDQIRFLVKELEVQSVHGATKHRIAKSRLIVPSRVS